MCTFVSPSFCNCVSSQWVTLRQLLPQRPKELRLVCRMLHWSGSKLCFLHLLRGRPLCLSGQPWQCGLGMVSWTWTGICNYTSSSPLFWVFLHPQRFPFLLFQRQICCICRIPGHVKRVERKPPLWFLFIYESHIGYAIKLLLLLLLRQFLLSVSLGRK